MRNPVSKHTLVTFALAGIVLSGALTGLLANPGMADDLLPDSQPALEETNTTTANGTVTEAAGSETSEPTATPRPTVTLQPPTDSGSVNTPVAPQVPDPGEGSGEWEIRHGEDGESEYRYEDGDTEYRYESDEDDHDEDDYEEDDD